MVLAKALLNLTEGLRVRMRIVGDSGEFAGTGVIKTRRIKDSALWVQLDSEPPDWLRRFPSTDARGRHVLVDRENILEVL